jgi:hypothetical protein
MKANAGASLVYPTSYSRRTFTVIGARFILSELPR